MKECKIINRAFLGFSIIGLLFLSSCYYDNYDDMLLGPSQCDTLNMTYLTDVSPIINQNCTSCHSGNAAAGNIKLETYDDVQTAADNGSLLGTIKAESGWSPMPKNQAPLDDCSISIIESWINSGTPK